MIKIKYGRSRTPSTRYSSIPIFSSSASPASSATTCTTTPTMTTIMHVNWSHFKAEFSGKSEEDAETHLLQTNDCLNAHHFLEGIKVNMFCLTLVGEARLWYESWQPINVNWQGLQYLFRQQYSKIGNTREQLFHVWRSFPFDENTETVDAYVTHIRQVATLLGYGEPQILKVLKNTLLLNCIGYYSPYMI